MKLIKPDKPCDHEWEKVKERLMPERKNAPDPKFTGTGAYFIKQKCTKCSEVRVLDYVVEK
jgi:hypothetical protein